MEKTSGCDCWWNGCFHRDDEGFLGSVNIPARLAVCNYGCILRKDLATKYPFMENTLNGYVRRNWERSHLATVHQRDTLAIERKTWASFWDTHCKFTHCGHRIVCIWVVTFLLATQEWVSGRYFWLCECMELDIAGKSATSFHTHQSERHDHKD